MFNVSYFYEHFKFGTHTHKKNYKITQIWLKRSSNIEETTMPQLIGSSLASFYQKYVVGIGMCPKFTERHNT